MSVLRLLGFILTFQLLVACGRTNEALPASTSTNTNKTQSTSACFVKGVSRENGSTWKEDCNSCACQNGAVMCTQMACL